MDTVPSELNENHCDNRRRSEYQSTELLNATELVPVAKDASEDHNDLTPDDILHQLGGCGRFQVVISTIVQAMKLVVCWSMVGNSFLAYVPDWSCVTDDNQTDSTLIWNGSAVVEINGTDLNKVCEAPTGGACRGYRFDPEIKTIVSEFDLVCDLSWVTATITSVQMAGMCVGSLVSGHVSDLFGRKPPLYISMAMLFVFLMVSYFSVTWTMFAFCKFFIGFADAFYLALYCSVQSEYALSKWRSIVVSCPSWALQSALFALVAWLLQDWKTITLLNALLSLGFFAITWFVPESFRWYISHDRYKEAETIVTRVSKWNNHPAPDFDNMCRAIAAQEADKPDEKYSMLDLFRRRALIKLTLPLVFTWFALGFTAYGINFGIKKLSGSIYFNIFVFSVASIPSKFISMYLQNRFGRKKASMIALAVCFIGGLAVGIAQSADVPMKDELTNYFALVANVGVDGVWGPIQTYTIELYPTALRNTGFGFVSILARLGAVVGPQFVYLGDWVPGIMYYMVAVLTFLSIVGLTFLPETMNYTLVDKMSDDIEKRRRKEFVQTTES